MLIAGNWKMNTDFGSAAALATEVSDAVGDPGDVQVVVCPPFISLDAVFGALRGSPVRVGGQNIYDREGGAYTGEISAAMLRSVGCDYVILGHSERRRYFGETAEEVNMKVKQALAHDLIPIVCTGETLEERRASRADIVVEQWLRGALKNIRPEKPSQLVLAYEPVWAIGTGENATPEQAQEMHAMIRDLLKKQFGASFAGDVHILYGGSMRPSNAEALLKQPDVDGGLVGGASLKADDFANIVHAAQQAI